MPKCWSNKRPFLWLRDRTCYVCGKEIESYYDSSIELIIPRSLGGTNELKNLALSHVRCNNIRGSSMNREEWMAKLNRVIESRPVTLKEMKDEKVKVITLNPKQEKQLRRRLWCERPVCFICFQLIDDFEDVRLEFIKPLAKGGTIEDNNVTISHGWCNQARGNIESTEELMERLSQKFSRWMKFVGKSMG